MNSNAKEIIFLDFIKNLHVVFFIKQKNLNIIQGIMVIVNMKGFQISTFYEILSYMFLFFKLIPVDLFKKETNLIQK